ETEDDCSDAGSRVDEVAFVDAFSFKYSPREGTPATRIPGAIPDGVAGERLELLISTVRAVARHKNVGLVGTTHEVLIEAKAKRGDLLQGRTRGNKVALLEGPAAWIGTYARVRFTGTTGSTFTARVVEQEVAGLG